MACLQEDLDVPKAQKLKKNKNNSTTCQFKKCDPFHFVCDPKTTSNKITCKSCDTETMYTEMHLGFHAVFVIYV